MQSANGPNKLGSMINTHADFQAALKEIRGTYPQALFNDSRGSDRPSPRLATSPPGTSVEALAEAAIEKALADRDSQDNEESQPDALRPQRQSDRSSGAQAP